MARPSRNLDQALLDAGLKLLPEAGCAGMSARRLAEHAGVNPGMFHYHFRSKDNFVRALLGRLYEEMFAELVLQAGEHESPRENLRGALRVLARFGRRHRAVLARLLVDALAGEVVAAEFIAANFPRHLRVLAKLIRAGQRCGEIERVPIAQVIAFVAGGVMVPVLLGTALERARKFPPGVAAVLDRQVLTPRAIEQRLEFALRGLTPHGYRSKEVA